MSGVEISSKAKFGEFNVDITVIACSYKINSLSIRQLAN